MTLQAETTNDQSAAEFRTTLGALAQRRVAEMFNVTPRHVRRWQHGDRRIPCGVGIVCNLLAMGVVTVEQVEAAALVPTRTNGGEPVPRHVEPAPEQSALACAKTAKTTAEKVVALAPNACRWPYGDPRGPDFHFCGNPVTTRPYCEHHRTMAYVAPSTRRLTKSPGEKQHPSGKPTHLIAFYEEGPLSLFNPAAAECSLNLPCSAWLGRRPRAQGRGLSRG